MKKGIAFVSGVLGLAILLVGGARAEEHTGRAAWAVLKCRYKDTPEVAAGADEKIETLFNGADGVRQYFNEISHHHYSPVFRIAREWTTMAVSIEQDRKEHFSRWQRTDECIKATGVHADAYAGVVVLLNVGIDSGYQGNVLLDPGAWSTAFAAHEMLHHLGLNHSYGVTSRKNSDWSAPGEYFDPWDIMSAMAVYGCPDLALPYKMSLGWVKADEVAYSDARRSAPSAGADPFEIELRPYSTETGSDPLGACVDVGGTNGEFTRYCVEYRQKSGWDRRIPERGVLIHSLRYNALASQHVTVVRDRIFHAGESFQTADGLATFLVKEVGDESARVRIEFAPPWVRPF